MTTRLLVARHGNTFAPGDVIRRVGTTDLPLVDSGLHQGRLLGNYLKQNHLIPDVLFTSKLKRAIQTAEQAQNTMGTDLPIETLSIFNEIDYGPDENQPEEQVVARIGKEALRFWEAQAIVPQGWNVDPDTLIKNWLNFSIRLRTEYTGKTCLIITSNGIARFLPYLTGNFEAFSGQYGIKIATGALCIFENKEHSELWDCIAWNVKPQTIIG
ncbi:phosphoglycerate mutase [Legionella gratiana]|uniref:phosphoglycerate mutase (2,3-diphosphoglycerate-dependent) n=1 Tax=Legionella gratiana TaxID=45066 RepID=A0A378JF55_9GAMM|nr:histidine phosphatase family protein [Legionella gratiana]KTD11974.1 phosphoglycerate mutase [Legionella gratiana]STX46422.1 phosphoglycerate mutase [Legionella gratiana]